MNDDDISVLIEDYNQVSITFDKTLIYRLLSLTIDIPFLKRHLGNNFEDLDLNYMILINLTNLNCDYFQLNALSISQAVIVFDSIDVGILVYNSNYSFQIISFSIIELLTIDSPNIESITMSSNNISFLKCKNTIVNILYCNKCKIERISIKFISYLLLYLEDKLTFLDGYCLSIRHPDNINNSYLNGEVLIVGGITSTYRVLEENVYNYVIKATL